MFMLPNVGIRACVGRAMGPHIRWMRENSEETPPSHHLPLRAPLCQRSQNKRHQQLKCQNSSKRGYKHLSLQPQTQKSTQQGYGCLHPSCPTFYCDIGYRCLLTPAWTVRRWNLGDFCCMHVCFLYRRSMRGAYARCSVIIGVEEPLARWKDDRMDRIRIWMIV